MSLAYNAYWTHTPVHSTFAPIKLVHLCARQLQRAIRSTPCSNSAVQLKARCVLRFVPQAAALTESGWLQQLILGTSSPAEASASPKPLSATGISAEAQWDATHYPAPSSTKPQTAAWRNSHSETHPPQRFPRRADPCQHRRHVWRWATAPAHKSVRVKLDDGRSVVRKVGNPDAVPHELVARWPYAFRQRVTTSASRSNARPAERTRRSRALKFESAGSRAILVPAPPNGPLSWTESHDRALPGGIGMGRIQRPTWAVPIVQMGTLWTPIDRVHRAIGTLHRNARPRRPRARGRAGPACGPAGHLESLIRWMADLNTATLPQHPFMLFGQMTTADPRRSPAGTESA